MRVGRPTVMSEFYCGMVMVIFCPFLGWISPFCVGIRSERGTLHVEERRRKT